MKKRHLHGLPLLESVSELGLDESSMSKLARMAAEARRLIDEGGLTEHDRDSLLEKIAAKTRWNESQRRGDIRARQKELLDELKQVLVEASFQVSGGLGNLPPASPSLEYGGGVTN